MIEYEFNLHLTAEEYLYFYEGVAKAIRVRSKCGKTIQFPAEKMRQFVLKDGIHGRFVMKLDANNKFLSVTKVK
ncbi:MAG: DUF2835 domain-containing protein [Gammaproteobacteria bacterium]|nr:DUF2835 domain-containing protein [Gammaproteobacteria bacterium]